MTPEGKIKEQIKKLLKEYGVYWFMPVQNGMGKPGLDFFCCANGHFLAIEAKAPGKEPTDRQWITMSEVVKAHGHAVFVSNEAQLHDLEVRLQSLGCAFV
jgi:hypothetical protein